MLGGAVIGGTTGGTTGGTIGGGVVGGGGGDGGGTQLTSLALHSESVLFVAETDSRTSLSTNANPPPGSDVE